MSKGSLGAGGSQVKQYRDAIDVVSWTGMVVGCVGMIYIYACMYMLERNEVFD